MNHSWRRWAMHTKVKLNAVMEDFTWKTEAQITQIAVLRLNIKIVKVVLVLN
jgi:hypothetical protein